MTARLLLALPFFALSCAPTVTSPPKTSSAAPLSDQHQPKAAPEKTESRAEEPKKSVIAELPPRCLEYQAKTEPSCTLPSSTEAAPKAALALDAIDQALSIPDPIGRNSKLLELEGCAAFEPGLIAGLRAELAPPECADGLVSYWLNDAKTTLSIEISQLLRGQSLGAKLLRADDTPPVISPPFSRDTFNRFLTERIRPWYRAQSLTVYGLAVDGSRLSGLGKAITAIEAGLSDLRFVDNVRTVPLPEELQNDAELVEVYSQGLEEALDPRKVRGRDALLVGLRYLGEQGVLNDPRLFRARAQLSRLFSGSRIDALEGLLLPSLPPLTHRTTVERLAAKLPPFFADRMLEPNQMESPQALRALLERGLPPKLRQHLERMAYERPEFARLFARALLEFGCRYFRPADFTRATILLGTKGALNGPDAKEAQLISALATALQGGPENAAQLMLEGPMLPDSMGKIEQLTRLAKQPGELGGIAAYDAAHLLSVIPQQQPTVNRWLEAERLFELAAKKLPQKTQQERARARAEDAKLTATQVRASQLR